MSLRSIIRLDIAANRGYPKSVVVLLLFRIAHALRRHPAPWSRLLYVPVVIGYKLVSEWWLGIEIPAATRIGPGLRLRHGIGVVINPAVVIGSNVMIRQNVTLGNRLADDDVPVIGDDVEIGAGAIVIGACDIGAGALIAAGAVVVKDVPPRWVAHPAPAEVRPRREVAPAADDGNRQR